MGIRLEEIVKDKDLQEQIEMETIGIKKMEWSYLNFEENVREIEHTNDILFNHILEQLKQLEALSESEYNTEKKLKAEDTNYQRNIWYKLYESNKQQVIVLHQVITYLSAMLDLNDRTIKNLVGLLKEAKKYGIEKQKTETELEIMKSVRDSFVVFQEQMRKTLFDMMMQSDQRIHNMLSNVLQNITNIKMVETETIKDELEEIKEQLKNRETPQPIQIQPEIPLDKRALATKQMFEELERMIRDEGITDKIELAKRLGITPKKLNELGYKELVEKYTRVVNKKRKTLEDEDYDDISIDLGDEEL